jgi:hypothetical protein
MKDIANLVKNFSPAQWLNVLFAIALAIIWWLFIRYEEIYKEKDKALEDKLLLMQKELEEQKKSSSFVFKLYQDCIDKK